MPIIIDFLTVLDLTKMTKYSGHKEIRIIYDTHKENSNQKEKMLGKANITINVLDITSVS